MLLEGKTAIVTGAGAGIGKAIAQRFGAEGAQVMIADIDRRAAEETARVIRDEGGDASYVQTDVSSRTEVMDAVAATVRRYGRLHVLVNNAGVYDGMQIPVHETSEELWDRVIGINLKGPFYFCKYAIPEIVSCGGGAIVNISSVAALTASPRPIYGASKAALISMTRCVARQHAKDGVRANVICPGPTNVGGQPKPSGTAQPMIPSGPWILERAADPSELASAVLFLASDEASHITGAVYPIDGGMVAL